MGQEAKDFNKNDLWKSVQVVLVIAILIVGLNKFIFTQGFMSNASGSAKSSISQAGLDYYMANYGDQVSTAEIEAIVRDYGCHMEIHIFKDGQLVKRFGYSRGQIFDYE